MSVAALVLAAGRGTRFGERPKLLADLEGRPLARHIVEAALASRAAPVVVVTGHRAAEVEAALSGLRVALVHNPNFADGLSTSLKAGFRTLPREAEGAIVLLADMPRVGAALIDRLVEAWRAAGRPPALVPTLAGQRANPVILSRALLPEILRLTGDAGAGPLLRGRTDVVLHAVDDDAVAADVDTQEALAALAAQARTTPSSTAP